MVASSLSLDSKTRTNAMISYFFLGWIFLLARRNPDFSHPFIRSHAKKATRTHIILLGGFIVYSFYLAKYIPYFPIPVLPNITLDKIISVSFFVILAFAIVRGAYMAHKGVGSEEQESIRLREAFARENVTLSNASETDKMVFLSSYLPLIGIITSAKHPNPITRTGAKIGSIWLAITLLLGALGNYSELSWIVLFVYILYVAFVGVSLFVHDIVPGFSALEKIPDITRLHTYFRAFFPYLGKLLAIIFGKKDELKFSAIVEKIEQKDSSHHELAATHFTDTKLPLPKVFIFIPVINLLFVPQIILRKNSTYILAILQGIVITLGLGAVWFFIDFSSLWQTFFLFAIFLGIANLDTNPFYKIPLVYETYVLLDFLTFGMSGKVGKLKEKHKESAKVSFKV